MPETVVPPEEVHQPTRAEKRVARGRRTARIFKIVVGILALVVVLVLVGLLFRGCSGNPKKQSDKPESPSPQPVMKDVVIDEADFPSFVNVGDPTKATWAQVQANANSLERSGARAMWYAIYKENADHFASLEVARLAVAWEVANEVFDENGRSSALVSVTNPIPVWNTGPVKDKPDRYCRGPFLYKKGMYYLSWAEANPYYGTVEPGDGVKANCLNITTYRKPKETNESHEETTPPPPPPPVPCPVRNSDPGGLYTPHNTGTPTYYNPLAGLDLNALSYFNGGAERNEANRGTGTGQSGAAGTGSGGVTPPATTTGDTGTSETNSGGGTVDVTTTENVSTNPTGTPP